MDFKFFAWLCIVSFTVAVSSGQSTSTDLDDVAGNSLSTSAAGNVYDDNYDDEEEGDEIVDSKKDVETTKRATLSFVKELKNVTKEAGDFLKLRCEVTGSIPASSIQVILLKSRIIRNNKQLRKIHIDKFFK